MRSVVALLAWGALSSQAVAFVRRSSAEESWKPAVETAVVRPEVDQNQLELGWSPRPTAAPELYGRYAGMMFDRANDNTLGANTCGFNGAGNGFTCISADATCSYSDGYIGCCEPSSCSIVKTTCIDYDASVAGDCDLPDDFHTICCGTATLGACFTWVLSTTGDAFTLLDCSARSGTSTLLAYNPALGVPSSTTEEPSSTTDDNESASETTATTETSAAATQSDSADHHKKKSSNTGAIVGGVVGGVAALALVGLAIFFILRKKKKNNQPPPQQQQQPPVTEVQNVPPQQGQPPAGDIPQSPQSFAPTSPSGTLYPSGIPPGYQGYPQQGTSQPYDPNMSAYGQSPYSPQSGYEPYSPSPQQFHGQYPPQQGFDHQQSQYNQYGALGFQPSSTTSPPPNQTPSPPPKESEAIGSQHNHQTPSHQQYQAQAQELAAVNPLGNESNRAELG